MRRFLGQWADPQAEKFAEMFAEDAVWVDGPNGVRRGATAVVAELTRQLSMFPGGWMAIDALVADGGTVMVEWHGGIPARGTTVDTKVMARFEINANGQIAQMRESFDMQSLVAQFVAAGFKLPG